MEALDVHGVKLRRVGGRGAGVVTRRSAGLQTGGGGPVSTAGPVWRPAVRLHACLTSGHPIRSGAQNRAAVTTIADV